MSCGSRGDLVFVALRPRWRGHAAWIGSKRTVNPSALAWRTMRRMASQPCEVVAAEIGVVDVVGEHVPHRDHDRVFHGDDGFLLNQPRDKPAVSCAEVGGVFGASCGHRGGAQSADEPPIAVAGLAGAAFAGRFVMPRAHSGPGGKVCGGAEATHVSAGLSDDDPGDGLARATATGSPTTACTPPTSFTCVHDRFLPIGLAHLADHTGAPPLQKASRAYNATLEKLSRTTRLAA